MKSPDLPRSFLSVPLAHRGLHNRERGIVENSLSAFRAAIEGGYGIELDVVESADGEAIVFHDNRLARLSGVEGRVADLTAEELGRIVLSGSSDRIPALASVLEEVAGRVPLLIELKDHDPSLTAPPLKLARSVSVLLKDYTGPVAVMGFNPDTVQAFASGSAAVPWGLTSCSAVEHDKEVPAARRQELAALADFDGTGAAFVSHDRRDPGNPAVTGLKARGIPVLCWTIRSAAEAAAAMKFADNITFEGYLP